MAKGKSKATRIHTPAVQSTTGTFTNMAGKTFKIQGLPPLVPEKIKIAVENEWKESHNGKLPTAPTYTIENVAGEKETHFHDDKTPKNKKETAEWIQYISEKQAIESISASRLTKRVMLCVMAEPTEQWRAEYVATIGQLPTNPFDLKMDYIETEVISATDDIIHLMSAVMRLTGMVDEVAVTNAEAAFRNQMEKATAKISKTG